MSETKTWRPIDAENVLFRAGLQDDHIRSQRAAGYVRAAMRELIRELNGRMAPPAPPQPEAHTAVGGPTYVVTGKIAAKAEPDYTCPVPGCGQDARGGGGSSCAHSHGDIAAAANTRIAELCEEGEWLRKVKDEVTTEMDKARRCIDELTRERDKMTKRYLDILDELGRLSLRLRKERDEAYREGVAAAKEACAKRLVRCAGDVAYPSWTAARIVRETEVPGP